MECQRYKPHRMEREENPPTPRRRGIAVVFGANAGELLSFGFTLSSCLQVTPELLQRVATDKDAMKVVKDVRGGSGCNCR